MALLACNLERTAASTPSEFTASPTIFAPRETGEIPVTPSETVPAELPTLTPTFTPTFTAVHLATPPGPTGTSRYITDPETRDYAPQKKSPSGSDAYQFNRYERPYTAGTMDYLPDVDLTRVELRVAPPWVYITFFTAGTRTDGIGRTMYGAEFDVNRDGRGEYLIWGGSPPGVEWTTDGVEVWKDSNGDVGGSDPQLANAPWTGGNGYDQKFFSGGQGADPDLAWIRQIEGGLKIQLAFKYSAIGNAAAFLWNGVADFGVRRPDWFDYNDHFTQSDAGSPLPIQADSYPLQALFGIDNTCRDAYGFSPTGTEPGLCLYEGSILGQVAWDIDHSGSLDSFELTTTMIGGDTVTLGQGACPAAGFRTAVTDAEGRYSFPALAPGTYCVGLIHTVPNPISISPIMVNLSPAENEVVNLAVPW
ncbi:MAG: carboxypeptidase-like regulatory domain-containing protein [Anaerolineales bacterium]